MSAKSPGTIAVPRSIESSRSAGRWLGIALLASLLAAKASAVLTVTCVYDENVAAANTVDRSAAFVGGEGAGNLASLVPDLRSFTSSLTAACQSGSGGVVDFESGELDSQTAFTVLFGGEKRLLIRQSTESSYVVRSYVNEVRTPISGTRALAKEMGSPHFEFVLAPIMGGLTNEAVVAVGFTLLGRNNSNARSQWTGIATLGDRQGNTGTITNRVANLNTGSGNRTDDVFFGFRAPPGFFITRVLVQSDTGAFTALDDLAFMTAVVAEPPVVVNSPPPAPPDTTGPQGEATPARADGFRLGPEWLIVGALAVIILLLLGLIFALRRVGRNAAAPPAVTVPAPLRPLAGAAPFPAELTEFAKQELVQGLYSQRQALIETQRAAEQRLAELEQWLSQLHLPLQDRIRAYEERIAELEKELATKDESVRELTRATLLLVRRKLAEEKERERSFSRYS